ncbi:tRNA lysidine(34) synthetase TilS [Fonticella tunisiensis]|uniref:tRNA(Ile)-lysidine synthase n=1 Tax=Fonticella tunisiensis TaxID=1096341 RepID=A0A4R7K986_9CLOT|nr:tRNA lysidine(34) synthetase TilS [Fonticella tunisiensis]TDT50302.1 tRNA(Ile)-lysidine synthase [Fonticella tunisiensis]
MLQKIISTIEKYNMIKKGDGIVVGLSGGPDSVCLLHVLHSLKDKYGIKLYAAHLNHMIRGDEALRDEEFAKSFAESLGIPFFSKRIKVEEFARENRMSSEEAGRFLRYQLFDEVAESVGANKIALAHNMNDQAETIIMRFFRGSGISGLRGISPVRNNKYIRPIIGCSRDEIERYCEEQGLNPVIDSTNNEKIYTRNKVRLEIIPYIRKHFNPNIISNLYANAEIIRDEDEYLSHVINMEYERIRKNEGIDIKEFNNLHIALKRRIIRIMIEKVKGNLNQIEGKHIEDCIELIERGKTGKLIELPEGVVAKIQYDIFKISSKQKRKDFEEVLNIPGVTEISDENIVISTRIFLNNFSNYSDNKFIKYFDYDKIKDVLKIRNRRDGDYMYPKGMTGRKKLKDIFIDKKIPVEERNKIPLIVLENEVIWAFGIRDTRNYKIDENTKRILEIKFERGANIERGDKGNTIE